MLSLPTSQSKLRTKTPAKGFSLIEVTISLGLVSFALVAVIGLLPTGMSTLRDSMNQTVEAQILQSIASRAVISDFSNVTNDALYFDEEGLPVASQAAAHYTANLTVAEPSFPGSGNAVALTDSLKNLRVEILMRPNQPAARNSRSYTIHVANSGN